jgi:hypothetical protein
VKYTIDTGFDDGLGGSRIVVEGEASSAARVREIVLELLGFDKEVARPASEETMKADSLAAYTNAKAESSTLTTPFLDAFKALREAKQNPEPLVPTLDAVADAVKLVVNKHGVARAAALLKEHGGARADLVPAEKRAAFIEAAQKAVSA